jgi:hypothetical protein
VIEREIEERVLLSHSAFWFSFSVTPSVGVWIESRNSSSQSLGDEEGEVLRAAQEKFFSSCRK